MRFRVNLAGAAAAEGTVCKRDVSEQGLGTVCWGMGSFSLISVWCFQQRSLHVVLVKWAGRCVVIHLSFRTLPDPGFSYMVQSAVCVLRAVCRWRGPICCPGRLRAITARSATPRCWGTGCASRQTEAGSISAAGAVEFGSGAMWGWRGSGAKGLDEPTGGMRRTS